MSFTNHCPDCGKRFVVPIDDEDPRCLMCAMKEDGRIRAEAREAAKSFWAKHPGGPEK